jgi:hypothetical protein
MSPAEAVLAGVLSVLLLVGSIYFALRVSARTRASERHEVFRLNMALANVAEATGLRYVGGGEYHHPIVGMIPGYGSLHGVYRRFEVHVQMDRTGTEVYEDVMRIEIVAAPQGFRVPDPLPPAAEALRRNGSQLQVERARIISVPRAREERRYSQITWSFPSEPEAIQKAIEDAVALAAMLS